MAFTVTLGVAQWTRAKKEETQLIKSIDLTDLVKKMIMIELHHVTILEESRRANEQA